MGDTANDGAVVAARGAKWIFLEGRNTQIKWTFTFNNDPLDVNAEACEGRWCWEASKSSFQPVVANHGDCEIQARRIDPKLIYE
jgi:hypothetical protein